MLSLDPHTLGEVLGDVRTLAQATDAKDAGVELVQDAASRIDRVRLAVRAAEPVRVAALEWLDPVFVAGHWTPQLIEYAGGFDVLGMPGEHSEQRSWDEVRAAQPEVVVVMPCGYDADRALEEAETYADELASLGARRVVAVDAAGLLLPPRPAAGRRPRAARATSCTRTGCPRRPARCTKCRLAAAQRPRLVASALRDHDRPDDRDDADRDAGEHGQQVARGASRRGARSRSRRSRRRSGRRCARRSRCSGPGR